MAAFTAVRELVLLFCFTGEWSPSSPGATIGRDIYADPPLPCWLGREFLLNMVEKQFLREPARQLALQEAGAQRLLLLLFMEPQLKGFSSTISVTCAVLLQTPSGFLVVEGGDEQGRGWCYYGFPPFLPG